MRLTLIVVPVSVVDESDVRIIQIDIEQEAAFSQIVKVEGFALEDYVLDASLRTGFDGGIGSVIGMDGRQAFGRMPIEEAPEGKVITVSMTVCKGNCYEMVSGTRESCLGNLYSQDEVIIN